MRASRLAPDLEGGGDAVKGFLEGDREVGGGVGAAQRPGASPGAAPPSEQVAETAHTPEEVGQILDPDLLAPKASAPSIAPGEGARGGQTPDLVVLLALLGIRQDGLGRGDVPETVVGGGFTRVGVGVELLGELAIGALELVLGGVGGHPQDRIEVLLDPLPVHACPASPSYSRATSAGRTRRSFRV